VATHAGQHHQQSSVVPGRDGDPILIFFPMADEAHIGCFNLQRQLQGSATLNFFRTARADYRLEDQRVNAIRRGKRHQHAGFT
jgi:hypothetical protein